MSKTIHEAVFDIIEEIPDDVPTDRCSTSKPSTSGLNRNSGKTALAAATKKTSSPPALHGGPSTSRGVQQSINNYLEIGSDTSSAAGFKMMDPLASAAASPSSTPGHHVGPPLEMELQREDSEQLSSVIIPDPPGHLTSARSPQISASNASNLDYLLSLLPPAELNHLPVDDPIIIRGNGNMTLFGLSNSFTNTFPSSLLGRVSREEFEYTLGRINGLLRQQHSTNAKFLLLGCLCCCCSLGCSLLWPTFALSKRTRSSLEKLLAMENSRMYNKLGLNWRLTKQHCHTNHSFMEYILVIDFLPKMQIYQPD